MITTEQTAEPETEPSPWEKIPWQRVEKQVRRLQERIYRAAERQRWQKVRSLQKLLAKSYYNKLKAIRDVSQRNTGRLTPGVDNKVYNSTEQRWEACQKPFDYRSHKPKPIKRVLIPKKDGSKRVLGIPTMDDRILQAIIKTALEPEWEARFEPHSYGFRPGRCTMDAINEIQRHLKGSIYNCWILDADISKCFDTIAHAPLLERIPVFKTIIGKWLRAGAVTFNKLEKTETGTPQGGIISPLLANIALDGLERLFHGVRAPRIHLTRYADDFVIITTSKAILDRHVIPTVEQFLNNRGLSLNLAKTQIIHRTEGFNFLGFNIRHIETHKGPKLLIQPTKSNILDILRKIKEIFKQTLHRPLEEIIPIINTIIRGWTNYYRHVNSKKSFAYLQYRLFGIIWAGLKRLHPKKPAKWLRQTYFQSPEWILKREDATLFRPSTVRIHKYTPLNGLTSPYDRFQKSLWIQRSSKNQNVSL